MTFTKAPPNFSTYVIINPPLLGLTRMYWRWPRLGVTVCKHPLDRSGGPPIYKFTNDWIWLNNYKKKKKKKKKTPESPVIGLGHSNVIAWPNLHVQNLLKHYNLLISNDWNSNGLQDFIMCFLFRYGIFQTLKQCMVTRGRILTFWYSLYYLLNVLYIYTELFVWRYFPWSIFENKLNNKMNKLHSSYPFIVYNTKLSKTTEYFKIACTINISGLPRVNQS